jgi:hypothetical protein
VAGGNRTTQIVVAVRLTNRKGFDDATEMRRMQEYCVLKAGKNKYKLTGHFPPWSGDPYLRLAFPRKVELSDKTMTLELYVPGLPGPYRELQFALKTCCTRASWRCEAYVGQDGILRAGW